MSFTIAVLHEDGFLRLTCSGPAGLADLCGLADFVARVSAVRGQRTALIDLLAVAPHLSFTEHLQLGTHVATALGGLGRIATVVPAAERTGNSERAAQRSGAQLRTFTQLHEAETWLLQAP